MCILLFISMCFLMNAIAVDTQQCYYPDGSKSNHTLCRPLSSDQASACCPGSNICLDNSLCLTQTSYGAIIRGSCTDPTWQSDECPRYCQDGKFQIFPCIEFVFFLLWDSTSVVCLDKEKSLTLLHLSVSTHTFTSIFAVHDGWHFCCADIDSSSNQCSISTRGSRAPFRGPAGKVIFNRTTGSTSPNSMDVITVTVSSSNLVSATVSSAATATVSSATAPLTITTNPSNPPVYANSPPSSEKSTKVGLEVGVPLGLAFLGTLGLLWRQRTRELGARTEARTWKEKYDELKKEKRRDVTVVEEQMHELHESWRPNEIGGRHFYEVAGNMQ